MSVVDRDTAAGLALLLCAHSKGIYETLETLSSYLPLLPFDEYKFVQGWKSTSEQLSEHTTTLAEILSSFKTGVSLRHRFNHAILTEYRGWRIEAGRHGRLLRAVAAANILRNVIDDLKSTTARLATEDNVTDDDVKSVVESGVRDCMSAINDIGIAIFGERSS